MSHYSARLRRGWFAAFQIDLPWFVCTLTFAGLAVEAMGWTPARAAARARRKMIRRQDRQNEMQRLTDLALADLRETFDNA